MKKRDWLLPSGEPDIGAIITLIAAVCVLLLFMVSLIIGLGAIFT